VDELDGPRLRTHGSRLRNERPERGGGERRAGGREPDGVVPVAAQHQLTEQRAECEAAYGASV